MRKKEIIQAILLVYDIIMQFHSQKVYLGNLSLFSFKKVSEYDSRVKLVDFNIG